MKQLLLITLLLLTTILFGNDGPPEPESPGENIAAPEPVAPKKAMRVQTKKKKKIIKKRSVIKPKATQPDKIPAQKVQKKSSGKRFSKRDILSSDAVKVVKISGSEHQQFNSCIKKHMVRFKFPAGYRETTISYPFKFRSNN